MAGKASPTQKTEPVRAHVLVIEARYYEAIANDLLAGTIEELKASGATHEVITVPGALEIPHVLASAAMAGLIPGDADGSRFDGAVALGCVIRGETSHYDIVCREANHWLNETALRFGVPVGNGILTVENEAQAVARAKGGRQSKGAEAARACLSLIVHARRFEEVEE
jgi:6,7-dimethyl-8-ribityllumazine synthase